MKKVAISVFLVLISSLFAFSQVYKGKARVFGHVSDEEGKPLEGVKVILYSLAAQSGFSVETDKKGKWLASWIRGGDWNIDFEKPGFTTKKISFSVSEVQKNPTLEVKMTKAEQMEVGKEVESELEKGNALFAEGKYDEAVKVYEGILEKHPEVYIINTNIGNCYFQKEEYEKAEEYYLKVYEKEQDNPKIILAIGNTSTIRGDDEKALEWYRKVDIEKVNDSTVLYNIGTNFYNRSQFEEALRYYLKAVEKKPDFLDAIYQLGLTYLTLGKYEDSLKTFESYLKCDSGSERAGQVRQFIEFLKTKIRGIGESVSW